MSSLLMNLRGRALTAFIHKDYEISYNFYGQAISMCSNEALLFSERSEVNIKLCKFKEALADAERAIELAPEMSMSHFRKGIACYHLKDYKTAKVAFQTGSDLVPEKVKFIKKCDLHMAGARSLRPSPQSSCKRPREHSGAGEAEGTVASGNLGANALVHPASQRRHSKLGKKWSEEGGSLREG